jgi:hypothetical protein
MATITDPTGTPSIVYNRSGLTIVEVDANGTTQGAGTPIPRLSAETVALVSFAFSGLHQAVVLPDDAEVGDVVEVYVSGANDVNGFLFPPSGESIGLGAANAKVNFTSARGLRFRKIKSTVWNVVGYPN